MAHILVTGASGFVGRSLIPTLISNGHSVRCAVSKHEQLPVDVEQVMVKRLEQQQDWTHALKGIDIVIHLAARVHIMKDKVADPLEAYCKVNSLATKHLAEQAAHHHVKRFVFLSSIKVNGEFNSIDNPFNEENPVDPDDPYGRSKFLAEQYLHEISQSTALEITIVRPPLIYGPAVKANFLKMMHWVKKGYPLPFATINNQRSFIFIENLASALCEVAVNPKAANQLYLVADNESWSLADLMDTLAKHMKVKSALFPFPSRGLHFILNVLRQTSLNQRLLGSLVVSNNKIKEQLNWQPPVSAIIGLKKTIEWYQNEHLS